MKLLLIILLCLPLYAQDVISVPKGGGKYNWTAGNTTKSFTELTITLRGSSTLISNPSGNDKVTKRVRYWIGYDGAKDSLLWPATFLRLNFPEDTLYYDCTTTQANGRWTEGADSFWVNIPPYYFLVAEGDSLISSDSYYLVSPPD